VLILLGYIVVLLCVFGGFVLAGGSLGPLYQPTELLMIGGAGVGAFLAANNGKAIKATFRIFPKLRRTRKYNKALYMELMAVQFQSGTNLTPVATVRVKTDTGVYEEAGTGDGPVDAAYRAIEPT
jgi:chemotaxis protein MotA